MSKADHEFFVYILRCADDSDYVGSTTDVVARVEAHNGDSGGLRGHNI